MNRGTEEIFDSMTLKVVKKKGVLYVMPYRLSHEIGELFLLEDFDRCFVSPVQTFYFCFIYIIEFI